MEKELTDIFSPEKRSWIMSRIRSTNTKIDLKMNQMLSELRCKYAMYPKMYGNPDFVIVQSKIAIFCDGDFWHGYKFEEKKKPAKKYWRNKIEYNMARDKKISRNLRYMDWSVLRFWEHDIEKKSEFCIKKIAKKIKSKKRI